VNTLIPTPKKTHIMFLVGLILNCQIPLLQFSAFPCILLDYFASYNLIAKPSQERKGPVSWLTTVAGCFKRGARNQITDLCAAEKARHLKLQCHSSWGRNSVHLMQIPIVNPCIPQWASWSLMGNQWVVRSRWE